MTKQIPLTRGLFATVSDEDYEELSKHKWFASKRNQGPDGMYDAIRHEPVGNGKRKTTLMARVVLERMGHDLTGKYADHIIIPETLNNTRDNLRPATYSESGANRRKRANCSSQYRGVCWYKRDGKWMAYINIDGKRKNLGYYDIEEDAARAYDRKAFELGQIDKLNFPEEN